MRRKSRKFALLIGACAVALVVVGASSGAHNASKSGSAGKTLVFGTSADSAPDTITDFVGGGDLADPRATTRRARCRGV